MRKMRLQAKLLIIDEMPDKKIKEAEKELTELKSYSDKSAPEIGRQSEMLMTQDHMCNLAIKAGLKSTNGLKMKNPKTGMVHVIKSSDDVIEFNEASMTTLVQQNKINPETKEQKAEREKTNAVIVKKCKAKVDARAYHKLTGNIAGFDNKGELERRHAFQESQFTMTFGFGMITLMFLGFVSGYFVGSVILEWDQLNSIFMSLFVGITTIIVEMLLMIFRISKFDKMRHIER